MQENILTELVKKLLTNFKIDQPPVKIEKKNKTKTTKQKQRQNKTKEQRKKQNIKRIKLPFRRHHCITYCHNCEKS